MDVYLARQPIFDRDMNVQGYELLYRKRIDQIFDTIDETRSSAELISNSFIVHNFQDLTGGTRGFIHFPARLILEDVPQLLPRASVAIEIREPFDASGDLMHACRRLKDMSYMIVLELDVLTRDTDQVAALLEIADVIRIDCQSTPHQMQSALIQLYRDRVNFLASNLESRSDYHQAAQLGFQLFQGQFFSKPVMLKSRDITTSSAHLVTLIEELHQPDAGPPALAGIIEKDLGLTYKLMKTANSAYYRPRFPLKSIQQAVVHLGREELLKWAHLMLLNQAQCPENAELIKCSLIRGKTLSLLANKVGLSHRESDCFMTGILSSIDLILNEPMASIVARLPLFPDVQDALLGARNDLRYLLDQAIDQEQGRWDQAEPGTEEKFGMPPTITRTLFMNCTIEAIRWQQSLPD